MTPEAWAADARDRFGRALDGFDRSRPVLILTHNDADGLAAGALLARALRGASRPAELRVLGRGENPWSDAVRAELRAREMGGLVVADLGVRDGVPRPGTPTVILDHHVPMGRPDGAELITGHGRDPTPTTSLLAHWCAGAVGDADGLLWLAALGIIGDLGDKAPFAELAAARKRYGATALREAVSLVNAPRRTAAGDAGPALALLMRADGPKALLADDTPEGNRLRQAREEVRTALDAGHRVAPKMVGNVALIRLHSPCQIHPLVAQSWRGRLRDKIVMAANTGYRPGWVHFAMRTADGTDLIEFLRARAPADAGEEYGSGHPQATGGALRPAAWNAFAAGLGFGPEMQVADAPAVRVAA